MGWITMNGQHVFINDNGEATHGPAHLVAAHNAKNIDRGTGKYVKDPYSGKMVFKYTHPLPRNAPMVWKGGSRISLESAIKMGTASKTRKIG